MQTDVASSHCRRQNGGGRNIPTIFSACVFISFSCVTQSFFTFRILDSLVCGEFNINAFIHMALTKNPYKTKTISLPKQTNKKQGKKTSMNFTEKGIAFIYNYKKRKQAHIQLKNRHKQMQLKLETIQQMQLHPLSIFLSLNL